MPEKAIAALAPPGPKLEAPPPVEEDPEQIAAKIASLSETEVRLWLATIAGPALRGNQACLLLRRWVELNPPSAISWVTQLDDLETAKQLTDVAAVAWSEQDLPAALTWVESLPADDKKFQALADVGYEVARVAPINALQIALQLPAGANTDGLLLHALAQYASADVAQSQQLALGLDPGPLRDRALALIATVQAKQAGPEAPLSPSKISLPAPNWIGPLWEWFKAGRKWIWPRRRLGRKLFRLHPFGIKLGKIWPLMGLVVEPTHSAGRLLAARETSYGLAAWPQPLHYCGPKARGGRLDNCVAGSFLCPQN